MNYKKLKVIANGLFSIFCILFAFIMLISFICMKLEGTITTQVFGGYKTDIITTGETDSEYYKSDYTNLKSLIAADYNLCTASEAEGAVLLENNNALPLDEGSKISLFSINSTDPVYTNGGAARFTPSGNEVNYKTAFEGAGFEINSALYSFYQSKSGYKAKRQYGQQTLNDLSWDMLTTTAKTDATYGDAAIFIWSRYAAEGADSSSCAKGKTELTNGDYLQLSVKERSVLDNLKEQKRLGVFKKIIVIVNSSNPMETNLLNDYDVDATLWIGLPGETGMYAVADIIAGKVTPSGHLTDMWFTDNRFNPNQTNFGDFKHSYPYVVYQEGIYSGYPYAETRYEDTILNRENVGFFNYEEQIAYPFGYGLSYAEFKFTDYTLQRNKDNTYTASVKVTNIGTDYSGKEVVQMYLQSPYTQYDIDNHIEKASVELVGFEKTKKLAPNESETLSIVIDGQNFASYDAYGIGSYILEGGKYYLTAATDAHNAINNILAFKGKTTADGMNMNGDASLVKDIDLNEDKTTYTVSDTGVKIKNLFDDADPNRMNDGVNSVQYITRNNWNDTVKYCLSEDHTYTANNAVIQFSDKIKEGRDQDANGMVEKDSIEYPTYGVPAGIEDENGVKQNLPLITMREDAEGNKIAYDNPLWEKFLDQLTWDETKSLLSLGLRQTVAIDAVGKPATIDQNGSCGYGQQKYYNKSQEAQKYGLAYETNDELMNEYCTGFTSLDILASSFNKQLAYAVGRAIGEESLWSGQAAIYGFGFNLHRSAYNGRRHEYYSEDPYLSGIIGGYESKGANDKGCYVYNKHFAMHEQETNRMSAGEGQNSYEVWANEQTIRERYLEPWHVALKIVDNREMNVMTSFSRIGAVWSGNCKALMTDWLRDEEGMIGIAISDFTTKYMGYASGVLAGNDLPDGTTDQFESMETDYGAVAWAMRESAHRILYTVVHSNAMNGVDITSKMITYEPEWISVLNAIKITISVLFGISTAFGFFVFVMDKVNYNKKKKEN